MTVSTAKEQLHSHLGVLCVLFSVVWAEKKRKPESKPHTSKKVLGFHNCLNGYQIMQLGLVLAFITSTTSLQIRTTHLILAARGTFPQQCSTGFCSRVSYIISRSREEQNPDQSRAVPALDTLHYFSSKQPPGGSLVNKQDPLIDSTICATESAL